MRITLRGHERHGSDFLLIFGVDDGRGEMTASVPVYGGHRGGARFPHGTREDGQSLGPVADAALMERATQTVAMLEAADAWRMMRKRGR